ncbi:44293_t:CDS:1, partial [Gigaspora margarita]
MTTVITRTVASFFSKDVVINIAKKGININLTNHQNIVLANIEEKYIGEFEEVYKIDKNESTKIFGIICEKCIENGIDDYQIKIDETKKTPKIVELKPLENKTAALEESRCENCIYSDINDVEKD